MRRIKYATAAGATLSRLVCLAMLPMACFVVACHTSESTPATENSAVTMDVHSVGLDNVTQAPVVLLQEHDGKRTLPIWIGPLEAQAIAVQLEGGTTPRPLTHDLLKRVLDGVGAELARVQITDLKEGVYRARISVRSGGKSFDLDSRPSDAIALALRFQKPIQVDPALLGTATTSLVIPQGSSADTLKLHGITVQNLTTELAAMFGVSAGRGVLVADVAPGAPGQLRRGDVILEVERQSIYSVRELGAVLEGAKKGGDVHVEVQRGNDTFVVVLQAGT